MKKNSLLALLGITLFFLVMTVFYTFMTVLANQDEKLLEPFIPFVVFSGFFIFLIGAILVAMSISRKLLK